MATSDLQRPWTPVEKRDTTPEAAALLRERWLGLTLQERLTEKLEWCGFMNKVRYDLLRQRNPGAPESEIVALWTETTYRDSLKPEVLAGALAAIRARGAKEAAASSGPRS